MPDHLSLNDSLHALVTANAAGRVVYAIYDNPNTAGDEKVRLLQPMRLLQSGSNVLVLCWQYGPLTRYLTFAVSKFLVIEPSPYPALFDTRDKFTPDIIVPFGMQDTYTRKECPFDRRRALNRDAELFFIDAAAEMESHRLAGRTPRFPLWPFPEHGTASRATYAQPSLPMLPLKRADPKLYRLIRRRRRQRWWQRFWLGS